MDNNDSMKPQPTGGLKIMTVFIVVLALHVLVIGGFTVYHLMSGGDSDIASTDKSHKTLKNADSSATADNSGTDASQPDKTASTAPPSTDVASTQGNPPTPTPDANATAATSAPTPAPAPTVTPAPAPTTMATTTPAPASVPAPAPVTPTPKPMTTVPPQVAHVSSQTPSGPIGSELAPPAQPAPAMLAPAPAPVSSAPVASGPVHMPAVMETAPVHEHQETYTVKITDSYKKIATAHHVTVAQLKDANHIKGDVLHTGQKLVIPSGKTTIAKASPAPVITPMAMQSSPATASLAAAPVETASSSSHLYTIVKGDTLSKIAHKFKTTASAIIAENGITDPAKLTIGKKLKIPSKESRSAKNAPPVPNQPSQVQTQENTARGQLANLTR